MRHRKAGIKLGRTGSHRNAMFRNMVTSLLKHGRIHTTDVKAKELRRWSDHIITLAKRGDLHARRQALSIVNEKGVVHRLFEKAGEQFGNRAGGYTRLIKTARRAGDAAPMTIVELISEGVSGKTDKKGQGQAGKKSKVTPPRPESAAAGIPKEDLTGTGGALDAEPEGQSPKILEAQDDNPVAATTSDDMSTETIESDSASEETAEDPVDQTHDDKDPNKTE